MTESTQVQGLLVQHAAPPAVKPERPPLLLVHGSGHGAWCWEHWMERLPQRGWEAYALSVRNHPGSHTVPQAQYLRDLRTEDYVDDVATVAAHIGRPCVVVGHSMGGIIVQRFAARHLAAGGALPALVLLAPAPPGQLGPLRSDALPTDVPYVVEREVAARRYFHTAAPEVVERALDRLCPESPAVANDYSLGAGVPVAADAITAPLLVVTAEHDRSVVPRDGRIADYYGGTWLHDADNGHDLMLEAGWAPLLERILAWLEGALGRG